MQADAYRRARTLMGSHSDLVVARVLGAIQSLLLLGLLGIICLFVALMASRGEPRFPRAEAARLPAWVLRPGSSGRRVPAVPKHRDFSPGGQ